MGFPGMAACFIKPTRRVSQVNAANAGVLGNIATGVISSHNARGGDYTPLGDEHHRATLDAVCHCRNHRHSHRGNAEDSDVPGLPLVAQTVKYLPVMRETWVQSLHQEDSLEKEMATHSSILAWKIPWAEEPGELQSMGCQRVGHD